MVQHVNTIVIGGGQAGLSASWHLKQTNREHVVLDRGVVGDSWRNRWDSLCLVTPNKFCQLPGFAYAGDQPDGFMLRDEIVDYLERFANNFNPPYRECIEVQKLARSSKSQQYNLNTSDGVYTADNVIIATGTHQHPNIPSWSNKLSDEVVQLHSCDYRNPDQLPDGGVLVVGSGQSGCQIVEDLLGGGRDVHLCVGNADRVPRRYRGKDIIEWEAETGYFDLTVDKHPKGREIRFMPHPHLSGRGGGRTIDLRQLALKRFAFDVNRGIPWCCEL